MKRQNVPLTAPSRKMSRLSGPPKAKLVVDKSLFGDRHKAENDAARIDLQDAAEPRRRRPQIALHVIVNAVGAAIAGK